MRALALLHLTLLANAMFENDRINAVRRLLFDHVQSPSLKHIRDPKIVARLADEIVRALDRGASVWTKWEGKREALLKAAAECWIPVADLQAFLNAMPGPPLTTTDVAQRLRAFHEEPYAGYPDERLREGCLDRYEREKAAGTELPAIVGALQEHVELETERLRLEREATWRRQREENRIALEQRFLAGADCPWTPVGKSTDLYIRKNGRAYRLSPTKEKRWNLFRISEVSDPGAIVGTYGTRGDASKALAKLAYEPEARW